MGAFDAYLASTAATSSFFDAHRESCYPFPLAAVHSPSQLFEGRGECPDGRAMIIDIYEEYRLTTDFNRRAPLLPDAQHGLGKIFAIVPLTCGSSQVLVLRRQTGGAVNAAVIDFVPPPAPVPFGYSISFVSDSVSLFIKTAPPSQAPVVAVCDTTGCTSIDLKSQSVTQRGAATGGDIAHGDETSLAISTTGKALLDGDIITSQGVPEVIAAVLFLPPLRIFIAVGTDKAASPNQICVIQPGVVACNPVPNVPTIREWVWLPPLPDTTAGGTSKHIADVLIIGGNATFPMLYCYIRFTGTLDTAITQELVAPCRPLPIPAVVASRQPRMIVHPWLPGIVECAAANATHVHVMMFNYSGEVATSGPTTIQGQDEALSALDALTAVTVVVRQFAAGSVIGLVPLPIGTTLILTANGAMDLAVPRIVAPFVPSLSTVANTTWCSTYGSGGTTTISCVDLSTYDPYMVRCEASAASRNALVYRGKPFSCQVYLAPFATAPASITMAYRQLLYNVTAERVAVTVTVTRVEFRGELDVDFPGTSFHVNFCVRPSNQWSCYRTVVDVANVDDLLLPWNSSVSDRISEPRPATATTKRSTVAPSAPPSNLSPMTATPLSYASETSAAGSPPSPSNAAGGSDHNSADDPHDASDQRARRAAAATRRGDRRPRQLPGGQRDP